MLETVTLAEREGVLITGPAKITVSTGAVDVIGKRCGAGDVFAVSYGKTYPLQAVSPTQLELRQGSSSAYVKTGDRLIPPAWDRLANLIRDGTHRVAMILGDMDTGKSSLALYTANRLSAVGSTAAVVDADVGQSDVGPPGVIGLCLVESPTLSLMNRPLVTGYFVGDKSPSGHFLGMVLGTKRMVDEAEKTDADAILIDTTGMVQGGPGRALKEKKIEAVSPDLIVALQRGGEIEHLLAPLTDTCKILRLPVPTTMTRRSRMERIALRGFSMRMHVKNLKKIPLNMDRIVLRETFLSTGVRKPEVQAKLADVLNCEVLHVEEAADVLLVVVKGGYARSGVAKLRERYDKEVKIVQSSGFARLMLGLLDTNERLLDIGFLESLTFSDRQLMVSTHWQDQSAVKYVKLGYLRIDEAGNEVGRREIGAF